MAHSEIHLGYMSMRHAELPQRMAAAARAGFDGLALRADRWQELRAAGWDGPGVRALLAQHRLVVGELEPLRLLRDDLLDEVADMVAAFDAPRVQVTPPIDGSRMDLAAAADWLAMAAARLPRTRLCFEFLPPTQVPDAASALRLIERAGNAPNLGLCVDTWHVFRGGGLASITGLDAARVFLVQINDGPLKAQVPDYIDDCIRFRLPCGEGAFDLQGFLQRLPAGTPVNVEVINTERDQLAPDVWAQQLHASTLATLRQAGWR